MQFLIGGQPGALASYLAQFDEARPPTCPDTASSRRSSAGALQADAERSILRYQ